MNPKITILTACYNGAAHIEETIQSVIAQCYHNLEYVIVDGGSTDGTLDIIKKYEKYVDVLISEPDNGISDAFNKGIKVATGDLICIVNSDDVLIENALNQFASKYIPGYDIYRCNQVFWNDKSDTKTRDVPTMKFPIPPLSLHICHNATFVTKEAYEKYGVYKLFFKYIMDLDFFVRAYKQGAKFFYIDLDVVNFRLGGVSQSHNKQKWDEYMRVISGNGGTIAQKLVFCAYLKMRFLAKKLVMLVNPDFRLKLTQKKIQ